METYGDILISGLLIGVLVSAPMGPVGMLCIQRSLNKGRWPGFFTGVGAAISDLFYCLLTGLGLAFIQKFINDNAALLQIAGSFMLVGFGIYLYRKNPAVAISKPATTRNNYWGDFVTGFLFTFSNPLILFFIISLFGRFNFLLPEHTHFHYLVGYTALLLGALLWWFVVSYGVNKLRRYFNLRTLRLLNRTIGIIIMAMAVYGIYSGIQDYIA